MRIVLVGNSYAPFYYGGAEHSLQELAERYRKLGAQVSVISMSGKKHWCVIVDTVNGVTVYRVPSHAFRMTLRSSRSKLEKYFWQLGELFRFRTFVLCRRIIRDIDPDIVHINNFASMGWLIWVAARSSVSAKVVQTARDYYLISTNSALSAQELVKHKLRSAVSRILKSPFRMRRLAPDALVSVSDFVADSLDKRGVRDRFSNRSRVIYNLPVLPERSLGAGSTSIDFTEGVIRFGFIGRVSADKGVEIIIDAVSALMPVYGNRISLTVAGKATKEYFAHLISKYSNLIEFGALKFAGQLKPEEFYSHVDVVLVPTQWHEPFGRVVAEALIYRKILVGSHAGGIPEVISAFGGEGLLVRDFTNPHAWSATLDRILRGEMDVFEKTHSIEVPAEKYMRLFQDLLRS